MTGKATFVKDVSDHWRGVAFLYRLDPPLEGAEWVVVSSINSMDNMTRDGLPPEMLARIEQLNARGRELLGYNQMGDEVMIFAADPSGAVEDWRDLFMLRSTRSIVETLHEAGYDVTIPGPVEKIPPSEVEREVALLWHERELLRDDEADAE